MPEQTFHTLAARLQKSGKTPQEIETIANTLAEAAFKLLFANSMAAFSEEDIKSIEDTKDEQEANLTIMELYKLRTGKNPADELQQLLDKAIKTYLRETQSDAQ